MSCAGVRVGSSLAPGILRGGNHAFCENSVGVCWSSVAGRSGDESRLGGSKGGKPCFWGGWGGGGAPPAAAAARGGARRGGGPPHGPARPARPHGPPPQKRGRETGEMRSAFLR